MTSKYCPACGTKAPSAVAKFCTNCGHSLNTLTSTAKTSQASRQFDDSEDGSDVFVVPELDGLQVTISGDDDDEKYVQTVSSFSLSANGGTVPKKFKPRKL
jgi:uncharacterized Zn finger protein (UPF0148 family)